MYIDFNRNGFLGNYDFILAIVKESFRDFTQTCNSEREKKLKHLKFF